MVAQDSLEVAFHEVFDLRLTLFDSPLAPKLSSAGETDREASAPACFTVTGMQTSFSLQKTIVPSRADGAVLALAA